MTRLVDQLQEAIRGLIDDGVDFLPTGEAWDLEAIRREAMSCRACPLHETRRRVVFGEGNPLTSLLLVGEGPGADEDRQGRPFVGAAGQLLDQLFEDLGLTRRDLYITNIVKCRPPGNRDPQPGEVEACRAYLTRQIAALRPRVILSLGKHATGALLGREVAITRLRGQVQALGSRQLVPTLHPAYVLRNAAALGELRADLQLAVSLCREQAEGAANRR